MLKKDKIKKIVLIVILVLCFSFPVCGCSINKEIPKKEIVPQEFKLLSAHVEIRNVTNQMGGIVTTDKYFHYVFSTDSGEVIFKEKEMYDTYERSSNYALQFELGDENKILQYNYPSQTLLVFIMTEEMYNQVFTEK